MFLSAINLSLLSLCYISSNNTITQTSFDVNPSFDVRTGLYTFEFTGLQNQPQLLRYDNQNLLRFDTPTDTDAVGFQVYISQSFNFSCYINVYDEQSREIIDVYKSFDCVKYDSTDDNDDWYLCYSYSNTDYQGYFTDWSPYITFNIRLLDEYTYNAGQSGGYSGGYSNGYTDGQSTGYTTGYTEGYNDGDIDGYISGFNSGSASGYQQGYTDALTTHDFTFTNLFGSIADTPILIIRRLFGFELFGVGLISVFMSLFTALIVIHLIKKVF